jgi:hypothetical protein
MPITNVEDVTANKWFAERLVSQDVAALVKKSIHRMRP